MATAAKSPPLIAPGILCPKCGGAMLDERMNKRSEKSPDYTCANMTCLDASGKYRTAIWLEKNGSTPAASAPTVPPVASPVGAAPSPEKPSLKALYKSATAFVLDEIVPLYEKRPNPIGVSDAAVASMIATLFIAATKER